MSKFAISAGHIRTLEAASQILREGGNAVDAAIAAYCMSFVSEPCMASAGAGGFAMIHQPGKFPIMLDFFCQTPKVKRPTSQLDFFPVIVDFGTATEEFYVGLGSVAVPGAIAGIYAMHQRYGTLPMKVLAEQAIEAAKKGVALDDFQAYDFHLLQEIMRLDPRGQEIFFEDGEIKKSGQLVCMEGCADFLECMVREGSDLFYKGEISKIIEEAGKERGGMITRKDLENYNAVFRKPILFSVRNDQLATCTFPSVGGMLFTLLMKKLESRFDDSVSFLSAEHFQLIADLFREVHPVKRDIVELCRQLSNFDIPVPVPHTHHNRSTGTSHFNIIDKNNMSCALTTSIGEGCGYLIPGTDMQLNNMLGESALLPGGYHSWIPDTRLQSMMSPTMAFRDKEPFLITGSGGAGRIPFALAQAVTNVLLFGKGLEEALGAPRINYDGQYLHSEMGYDIPAGHSSDLKLWKEPSLYFGGTHSILNAANRLTALGDFRRQGVHFTE